MVVEVSERQGMAEFGGSVWVVFLRKREWSLGTFRMVRKKRHAELGITFRE
jgi:hypothetical protein